MHKHNHMYDLCKTHMHSYVLAELNDGSQVDGIITGLDDENVYFAVPIEGDPTQGMQMGQSMPTGQQMPMGQMPMEQSMPNYDARYGYGFGYGFPGYGYGGFPGYGYPGHHGPRRRFRRLVLPLAALTALSVLPWY